MSFQCFSEPTVAFFSALKANNNKAWFEENRGDYDTHVVAPAKDFVAAMADLLSNISPEIHAEPRVNGSIVRINRDVRFSKDKSPYKTHLDLWFWTGNKRGWDRPGFFFRLQPPNLILGAGMHKFEKPQLSAYRDAVMNAAKGTALRQAIADATAAGPYTIGGIGYKRVPRGVPADHPDAELLRHNGLYIGWEGPIPKAWTTADLPHYCMGHFTAVAPVFHWLMEMTAPA